MPHSHHPSVYRQWIRQWIRPGARFLVGASLSGVPWLVVSIALAQSAIATPAVMSGSAAVSGAMELYQAGRYLDAIAQWSAVLPSAATPIDRARIHSNLAQAYRQVGQIHQTIEHLSKAIALYAADGHLTSRQPQTQLLVEQAQSYSLLGQHQKAMELADRAVKLAQQQRDRGLESAAKGVFGSANWALGNYDSAIAAQQESLKLAESVNQPVYVTTALGNLGNALASRAKRYQYQASVARSEGDVTEQTRLEKQVREDVAAARASYERSVTLSDAVGGMAKVKALLNLNRLLSQDAATNASAIANHQSQVLTLLNQQPASRATVYALVNLSLSYPASANHQATPLEILQKAVSIARSLGDSRAASFALGALGRVYETIGDRSKALDFTRQAQMMAQQVNAGDSLYRWQWQAGALMAQQGKKEEAIGAYRQAIATLQSIRSDILAANRDLQFDVRDSVEPIYRELIDLLVSDATANASEGANLTEALNMLELLKLTELQNFFGDECVRVALERSNAEQVAETAVPSKIAPSVTSTELAKSKALKATLALNKVDAKMNQIDSQAAVVYSVVLNQRTVMILRSPNGTLKSYTVNIPTEQLQAEIGKLRYALEDISLESYLTQSQKVYDLLMRPLEKDLAEMNPSTLVFINDGILRTVPMSALHDGKQFLVEKYAIANTLSLTLTNRKMENRQNANALIFGLTVPRPPYAALPNVAVETTEVQSLTGGTRLLDEKFTLKNFETQLSQGNYSMVHLATHGKFGVDGDNTYLLTYDHRITLEQVEAILRRSKQRVDLLTLSACQTAAGDNRSALGIAGVAIRAGVESTLATLWFINDADTVPLIHEFYQQLKKPGVTKAQALRTAQLKMIADPELRHPAVWSPLILIGNWN